MYIRTVIQSLLDGAPTEEVLVSAVLKLDPLSSLPPFFPPYFFPFSLFLFSLPPLYSHVQRGPHTKALFLQTDLVSGPATAGMEW